MRIIHAISILLPLVGGTSIAVVGKAWAEAALGHEVTIHTTDHSTLRDAIPESGPVGQGHLRIVVHSHIPPGSLTRHASIGLWRALAAEIPKADVVHLHSLYMFHDWAVWRECRRAGVSYILQPHGSLDPFIFRHHRWRKVLIEKLFQDRVTRDAALIYLTSDAERDLAKPYIFGRPSVVIALGTDEVVDLLSPTAFRQRHPEIGDRRIVLFLGRINFKKGFEILIPAFAAALRRNPDLHLVVAGPDGGHLKEALKLISANAVSDHTTLTGHLDRSGVVEAYAAADLFVLPSHSENFGIAAAEAMSAGVPCILSDKVQIAELAAQHNACWIVPLAVSDWTEAILHALSSADETREMRQSAKQWAMSEYSWPARAERLITLYAGLSATRSA
jgi:glycosyltransferase involved in cell wall biosynthesis